MHRLAFLWLSVALATATVCPAAEKPELQQVEQITVDDGKTRTLAGDVHVTGNVLVTKGVLAIGDHTLTLDGSLSLPGKASVGRLTVGDKGRIVFAGGQNRVLSLGEGGDRPRLSNLVVNKPGARLTIRGGPVIVEKTVDLQAGSLAMANGGELWMGVSKAMRKDGTPADVALRVTTTLTREVVPEIVAAPIPEMEPGKVRLIHNTIGPAIPDADKLVNIAPEADIRTIPYMTLARKMVDEDPQLRTFSLQERGVPAGGVRYDFRFTGPRKVVSIDWAYVGQPWALLGDTTGDGTFDTLLRADLAGKLANAKGGTWTSRSWVENRFPRPLSVHAIRLVSLLPKLRSNRLYDFRILCRPEDAPRTAPSVPEADVPLATTGRAVELPVTPPDQRLLRGVHIETWMLGHVRQWINTKDRKPFGETPGYQEFVKGLRALGGNVVNLWPPKTFEKKGPGTYESDLLWPSQYDRHSVTENYLAQIATAFHKDGIDIVSMLRVPYPKPLDEMPEASRSKPATPYMGLRAREYLDGITREIADSGVDIVGVGYDEQQNSKASQGYMKPDAATKAAFEKEFGIPVPTGYRADTEAYRKWLVFSYEQFASYIGEAAAEAKLARPGVKTHSPMNLQLGTSFNNRMGIGIAEDILCQKADLDYIRAYSYQSEDDLNYFHATAQAERARGANAGKGVISLHNCPWASSPAKYPGFYHDFTPVWMSAPAVLSVMHGADIPLYWRYNFVFRGGYDAYVKQAFALIDALAAWGGKQATPPKTIAVLKSRASEDWWQLRQRYGADADPMDQTRGYLYEKWIQEFLITNGYPYDIYYLDQPETFAKTLSDYDLVVLPFPYSMPERSLPVLEKFVAAGKPVLALGQNGPTDEWGVSYAKPLLASLIDSGKVSYVGDDVTVKGHEHEFNRRMCQTFDTLLGDANPLYFDPHGQLVEVAMLERGADRKYVCLVNWTDRPARVDVGVRVPAGGSYELLEHNGTEAHVVKIGGQERVTDKDLRRFRIALDRWEIKLLYVRPSGD